MELTANTTVGELKELSLYTKYLPYRDRMRSVILRRQGKSLREIAKILDRSNLFVERWNIRYKAEGGLGFIDKKRDRKEIFKNKSDETAFVQRIVDGPQDFDQAQTWKRVEIKSILEKEFNIFCSLTTVSNILKKLNISYQKPRPIHPKKDEEYAQYWQNEILPEYWKLAKKYFPDKEVEIWYQDETRFGAKTRLTGVYSLKNQRPIIPKGCGFKNAYLFGSINPETGEHIGHLYETCNTDIMNLHLKDLSIYLGDKYHALLVVDGAGWHKSKALEVPDNITLIPLPPYSPELNPIECLWFWIKDKYLSNKVLTTIKEILDAGAEAWNALTPAKVKSVCCADNLLPY